MVYNDTTNYNGMIQESERWLFGGDYGAISSNSKLLKTFTINLNYGMDQTATHILEVDKKWQFDDTNHTDLPIGTTDLVAAQGDYSLDVEFLSIEGVEILDAQGNYQPLKPISYKDIQRQGLSLTEYKKTDGTPEEYIVKGSTIQLKPAPASGGVTLSAGMKVIFKRPPVNFVSTDTIKVPGIPETFHDVPVLYACAKYAKQNSMTEKARELDAEISRREDQIEYHYSQRLIDIPNRMIPNVESNK